MPKKCVFIIYLIKLHKGFLVCLFFFLLLTDNCFCYILYSYLNVSLVQNVLFFCSISQLIPNEAPILLIDNFFLKQML